MMIRFPDGEFKSARFRYGSACLLCVVAGTIFGWTETAYGQAEKNKTSAVEKETRDRFPQSPRFGEGARFYRGSYPPVTGQPSITGFYLNWRCWVPVLGLFFLWVRTSHWINTDSQAPKHRRLFWNSVTFSMGLAGFLSVFILPSYGLGLSLLVLTYVLPMGFYIHERNALVRKKDRVLSLAHLQNVATRTLTRFAALFGSAEKRHGRFGPPLQLIGKPLSGLEEATSSRLVERSKGVLAAKRLVFDAIERRATDIHLEPKDSEFTVRLRIDGVMYPTSSLDRSLGESVCNIFKVLSAMDITQKRRAQDGSFRGRLSDRDIDIRVATQGTQHGEKMSLRILDKAHSISTLGDLGLRKQLLEKIQTHLKISHGMLLSCGPTGSGKSTTLYAAVRSLNASQKNIITLEDPIEFQIENVNQIEINEQAGQAFGTSLRSILRQDSDVLMIGEIRDAETAELACQAANTGQMVFSTIHANDSITALYRLLKLKAEPSMVASVVTSVLGQRLLRRLCPDCREAYSPSADELETAGLPAEKIEQLYRCCSDSDNPCETCDGMGYLGRIGVFEFLEISDQLRELIREKASLSDIHDAARSEGMLYMREEGLRVVALGITSLDELLRVVD